MATLGRFTRASSAWAMIASSAPSLAVLGSPTSLWGRLPSTRPLARELLLAVGELLGASSAPVQIDTLWHALFAQYPHYRLRAQQDMLECWPALALMEPWADLFTTARHTLTRCGGERGGCGFSAKAVVERKNMRRQIFRQSLRTKQGELLSFSIGIYEILEIAHAAHEHMEQINAERNLVIAGLRHNGTLAYRPSLSAKKLARACEQPWTAKLSQGNHRMPARWLAERGR